MPSTTIRKTEHLAPAYGRLEWLIDITFPGMAHFAGTGPGDQCCGGCRHWAGTATRKQAPCGKFGAHVAQRPRGAAIGAGLQVFSTK